MAAEIPDRIVLKRHRDLDGRRNGIWIRRGAFTLLCLFLLLGLLNVFGQRPGGTTVATPEASLELYAPTHLRGGLLYQARFTITAHDDVKNAVLEFAPGWSESQTMNTIEPSPISEASRDGNLLFTLGHVPAGQIYRLYIQVQVNPTNVGRRDADVTLYDGGKQLAHLDRTITVYP
jgi:hypothetical protein